MSIIESDTFKYWEIWTSGLRKTFLQFLVYWNCLSQLNVWIKYLFTIFPFFFKENKDKKQFSRKLLQKLSIGDAVKQNA